MPRRPPMVALLAGALCLLGAVPAPAVVVEGLYTASVEVVDKGREARREGFRSALEQVLVKATGSAAVASNPDSSSAESVTRPCSK